MTVSPSDTLSVNPEVAASSAKWTVASNTPVLSPVSETVAVKPPESESENTSTLNVSMIVP